MVEIGAVGTPWRASAMAAGASIAAESEGAHAFWYPDVGADSTGVSPSEWRELAGELARLVPDPSDVADPIVSTVVALMVTRRMRVGVLGWMPGPAVERAAQTVASLADLAPGRAVVACSGPDDVLEGFAKALRPDLDLEFAVYGADPKVASGLGWSWIGSGFGAAALVGRARDAGVTESVGIHLRVIAHTDGSIARAGVDAPLIRALGVDPAGDGIVVGTPTDVDKAIDEYVEAGVTRIILENLLPLGAPDQLEGSQVAVRGSIRRARLRYRVSPGGSEDVR